MQVGVVAMVMMFVSAGYMLAVAAHDSFSAPALVVFVVSVAALWAAAEGMSWMRSFFLTI